MAEHLDGMPASTPRVTRSPYVQGGKIYAFDGSMFEDGLDRVVISTTVTPEAEAQILEWLETK